MCSKTTLLALSLIAAAVIYQYYKQDKRDVKPQDGVEYTSERKIEERIAIGLNADVDYILSAVDLLTALKASPGRIGAEHLTLSSIEDLQQTVAYSMATCSGIERHFESKKVFNEIVQAASQLKHEEFVGGNAALMANKIAEISPQSQVMLVAPVGAKLHRYLDRAIKTESATNTEEEIHIILEYAKGEKWGEVTATCANRVIISHDVANSRLNSLERFGKALKTFDPSLVILSGLHMLEGQPRSVWMAKLDDTAQVLKDLPRVVPIHLEMATVGNLQLLPHIADIVFPHIDSLGLNEQELVSLAKSKGADFDFTDVGPKPSITHVSDLLHWLYSEYSVLNRNDSRLSRVHFHSLSFHVIVVPKSELRGVLWSDGLNAVMKGSRTASLQACNAEEINSVDFELQIPDKFQLSHKDMTLMNSVIENTILNGYAAWQRNGIDYYLAPVHVCKAPVKTVGLGDAISATGLLQSRFKFTKRRLRTKVKK